MKLIKLIERHIIEWKLAREGDKEDQSGSSSPSDPKQNPYVLLTVAEAISVDVGRSIARIDQ